MVRHPSVSCQPVSCPAASHSHSHCSNLARVARLGIIFNIDIDMARGYFEYISIVTIVRNSTEDFPLLLWLRSNIKTTARLFYHFHVQFVCGVRLVWGAANFCENAIFLWLLSATLGRGLDCRDRNESGRGTWDWGRGSWGLSVLQHILIQNKIDLDTFKLASNWHKLILTGDNLLCCS